MKQQPMGSLEDSMHGMDEETPPATKAQVEKAIWLRLSLNEGDSLTTAKQLAEILDPYCIALQDIYQGLPGRLPNE